MTYKREDNMVKHCLKVYKKASKQNKINLLKLEDMLPGGEVKGDGYICKDIKVDIPSGNFSDNKYGIIGNIAQLRANLTFTRLYPSARDIIYFFTKIWRQ